MKIHLQIWYWWISHKVQSLNLCTWRSTEANLTWHLCCYLSSSCLSSHNCHCHSLWSWSLSMRCSQCLHQLSVEWDSLHWLFRRFWESRKVSVTSLSIIWLVNLITSLIEELLQYSTRAEARENSWEDLYILKWLITDFLLHEWHYHHLSYSWSVKNERI